MEFESHWDVREIDLKKLCLDDILYYLKNRQKIYYWMLFFHDGSVECNIVDDTSTQLQYYHLFVWYEEYMV